MTLALILFATVFGIAYASEEPLAVTVVEGVAEIPAFLVENALGLLLTAALFGVAIWLKWG